jgi:outer membrane receptor protein involved in Fe transport
LYFVKITDPGGAITQPNLNLKLTKAMHHVLGYNISLTKNLHIKAEAYYQYLYHVPVSDDPASTFSLINSLNRMGDSAYVNKGKGYNKGIEITVERSFADNYYFLFTGALFDSKYKPANGNTYNTRFNTIYQANWLAGKDFKMGQSKQQIFSVNARAVVHGGFRYTPAYIGDDNGRPYLYSLSAETNSLQIPRFLRFDAGLKFRQNNRRYSWIISLDIQNITNRENILDYEPVISPNHTIFYSPDTDLGIIPILNLKVEF